MKSHLNFVLLIFAILIFTLFKAKIVYCSEQKQITVIFRYDDYSSLSPTELEVEIINAFKNYNIPLTLGVIPYICKDSSEPLPLSLSKAEILKNAIDSGILETALHGYCHQMASKTSDGTYSEFSGVDYNSQIKKITDGKNLLEEMLKIKINTFIPPWNSYDLNTIEALEAAGFKHISADSSGITKESSVIKYLPMTTSLLNLSDTVRRAKEVSNIQPVIVAFFHPFEFVEIDNKRGVITYHNFVELLKWIKSQEDVSFSTIGETGGRIGELKPHLFTNNSYFPPSTLYRLSPQFLNILYFNEFFINGIKTKWWLFLILLYLVVIGISAIISLIMVSFINQLKAIKLFVKYGWILILGISIYVLQDFNIALRGALAITSTSGIYIGILYLYKFKK